MLAAKQAESFADWIGHRDGYRVSRLTTFHALLVVCPWDTIGPEAAPWRVVRATIARLGYC
ncbi:MAG: hypothetical protein ACO23T_11675 [Hylemonella sp.]